MDTKCPVCGKNQLVRRTGKFRFTIPGGQTITVRDARWEQCNACNESIIDDELSQAIDREAEKHEKRSGR
jgi:YgiT-type zinc finger domain-containing protein